MKPRILIIEDESHIGQGILFNLQEEGYEVVWVKTGEDGLKKYESFKPHAIILDIMLPGMNGLQILTRIRSKDDHTPILILSAKDQDKDKIKGLKLGGDDYLAKPFNLEELLLRVSKMVSRNINRDESEFFFGSFLIQKNELKAKKANIEKELTLQEIKIIELLVLNKGKVVSREQILTEALGYKSQMESRTVDNFIVRLRKYFEEDPRQPKLIKSVRGVGYKYL